MEICESGNNENRQTNKESGKNENRHGTRDLPMSSSQRTRMRGVMTERLVGHQIKAGVIKVLFVVGTITLSVSETLVLYGQRV